MSKHGTIKRYILIIEKIDKGNRPSFYAISSYLHDHGFEYSKRTLQRDVEHIRVTFGIDIIYDRKQNGYFIDYERSVNVESFHRFLEIAQSADLLTESLADNKNTLGCICFEAAGSLHGLSHLKPLLQAIKDTRLVRFRYFNFQTTRRTIFKISPYLLREYRNRWYVVGVIGSRASFTIFGIDRIEELEILQDGFTPDPRLNPNTLFDKIIGVRLSENELCKVVLSFSPGQGKYIKTLPLHKSQRILIDSKKELRIELDVVPNFELNQVILMHGDTVTVMEPKWLADEIAGILKNSLKKYQ